MGACCRMPGERTEEGREEEPEAGEVGWEDMLYWEGCEEECYRGW